MPGRTEQDSKNAHKCRAITQARLYARSNYLVSVKLPAAFVRPYRLAYRGHTVGQGLIELIPSRIRS